MHRIPAKLPQNTISAVRPASSSRVSTVALLAIVVALGANVANAQFSLIRPVVADSNPSVGPFPDFVLTPLVQLDGKGTLWVNGLDDNDDIRVIDDVAVNKTIVEHGGSTRTFFSDDIHEIYVDLGDGLNNFSYQPGANTRALGLSRNIRVIGGDSFDYVTIRLSSNAVGRYVDVTAGVSVYVETGRGQDVFEMPVRNILKAGSVSAVLFLGDGGDGFTGRVEGSVAGAVNWIVFGEDNPADNPDELIVDFVDMDLESGALAEVRLIGGDGPDHVELWHRGVVKGETRLNLRGGNLVDVPEVEHPMIGLIDDEVRPDPGDTVICNIGLLRGSTGAAFSEVAGGVGNDVLVHQVRNQNRTSDMQGFSARLNGGPGYDDYYRTRNVQRTAVERYDSSLRQDALE